MISYQINVHTSRKQVQVLTTGVFQKEFEMNPDGREVQEGEKENDPVACPLLLRAQLTLLCTCLWFQGMREVVWSGFVAMGKVLKKAGSLVELPSFGYLMYNFC